MPAPACFLTLGYRGSRLSGVTNLAIAKDDHSGFSGFGGEAGSSKSM